ncbi:MAG TPA: hypothetical protein VMT06_00190 [Candidatus Eisenbacteria bacterium]|nr:hypothetical protein [Candidatus Eisenbacteria bacterium]
MKPAELKTLLADSGQTYSELLDIDLSKGADGEVFKWFLAFILFGAPITENSVIKTYRVFEKRGILTPQKIVKTGWDGIVKVLDKGSYTRYDFKTASKLLLVIGNLLEKYDGSLNRIHDEAEDPRDLELKLKGLGKGIGSVTVGIFLRELRGVWKKADPVPTELVIKAAVNLGLIKKGSTPVEALEQLKSCWSKNRVRGMSFVNLEAALVRVGKGLRAKKRRGSVAVRGVEG